VRWKRMVCCLAGIFLVFGGCCVLVVVAWHTSTDVRRLFVLLPTDGGGLGDVDFDSLKGASMTGTVPQIIDPIFTFTLRYSVAASYRVV
jgi:hypothetical protein